MKFMKILLGRKMKVRQNYICAKKIKNFSFPLPLKSFYCKVHGEVSILESISMQGTDTKWCLRCVYDAFPKIGVCELKDNEGDD